jgi:hypothetical protein
LFSKFGNRSRIDLKNVFKDYFTVIVANAAREKLHFDIVNLNLPPEVNVPVLKDRRSGPNQHNNIVDDLFTLVQFVDEHKLQDSLPSYVCSSVDEMPSTRLLEGDMCMLLAKFEKFDKRLDSVFDKLAVIGGKMAAMAGKVDSLAANLDFAPSRDWPHLGHRPRTAPVMNTPPVPSLSSDIQTVSNMAGAQSSSIIQPQRNETIVDTVSFAAAAAKVIDPHGASLSLGQRSSASATTSATEQVMETAPKVSFSEQLDTAWEQRIDQENNGQSDSTNPSSEVEDGGFMEVRNRRSRKRTRVASSEQPTSPGQPNGRHVQQLGPVRNSGSPAANSLGNRNSYGSSGAYISLTGRGQGQGQGQGMLRGQVLGQSQGQSHTPREGGRGRGRGRGRSLLAGRGMEFHSISAVRPVRVQKKVYCIDNLSVSVTSDMMWDFLRHELHVDVQSLYPAQTRRRRNDVNFRDRTAFRVCINADDVQRLLQEYAWPEGVVISEWYYIPPEERYSRTPDLQHGHYGRDPGRDPGGQRTVTVGNADAANGSSSAVDMASHISSVAATVPDLAISNDPVNPTPAQSPPGNLGPSHGQPVGGKFGSTNRSTSGRSSGSSSSCDSNSNDSTASTLTALETSTLSARPSILMPACDDVTAASVSSSPVADRSPGAAAAGSDDFVAVMDISEIFVADEAAAAIIVTNNSIVTQQVQDNNNQI